MAKDSISKRNLFDEYYKESFSVWGAFFAEANNDLNMYLGAQWTQEERNKLAQENRNSFVFNKIKRVINLITGYQRKHRLSSVVLPVEDKDRKVSDQITKAIMHVMNRANGYNVISDCFGGALKTGWNLCSVCGRITERIWLTARFV